MLEVSHKVDKSVIDWIRLPIENSNRWVESSKSLRGKGYN
jgi:hypothetical protein